MLSLLATPVPEGLVDEPLAELVDPGDGGGCSTAESTAEATEQLKTATVKTTVRWNDRNVESPPLEADTVSVPAGAAGELQFAGACDTLSVFSGNRGALTRSITAAALSNLGFFRIANIKIERIRVRKRTLGQHFFWFLAAQDPLDRNFHLLPIDCPRDRRNGHNPIWNVTWRQLGAYLGLNGTNKARSKLALRIHHHESNELTFPTQMGSVNYQRVRNFIK